MARRGVQDGQSALFVAAINDHVDVLNVLLDAEADMDARSKVRRVGGGSKGLCWGRGDDCFRAEELSAWMVSEGTSMWAVPSF
ncbi:hypothetical protein T484DRAFT_1940847 [Baffinella frigidus]|nr:hypothetical protein T484DRAFT_1940847 [Cryptophyta sp. CCMP2293]